MTTERVEREPNPFVADTDQLLMARDAAAVLGVSESTARTLLRQGKLPEVRPSPGCVRVRLSDLNAYMAGLVKQRPTEVAG